MSLPWLAAAVQRRRHYYPGRGFPLNRSQSSGDEYTTPDAVFIVYDKIYGFTLDACATPRNHKVRHYYTLKTNALIQPWRGTVWCNPPYNNLYSWVQKAYQSALDGATVVMLLPSWTGEDWFHDFCVHSEITLLRGRVRFNGHNGKKGYQAKFGSMICVFRAGSALNTDRLHVTTATHAMRDEKPKREGHDAPQ
jgi:phage N-6-adenine-methyltransferase